MLEKKIIKIIEIFTLGFVFPILVVYFSLSSYILIFLFSIRCFIIPQANAPSVPGRNFI